MSPITPTNDATRCRTMLLALAEIGDRASAIVASIDDVEDDSWSQDDLASLLNELVDPVSHLQSVLRQPRTPRDSD